MIRLNNNKELKQVKRADRVSIQFQIVFARIIAC